MYYLENDSSKVRIDLPKVVKHSTSGDVLNGGLEVKGNQKQCWVSLGKVLNGLDHVVGTIRAPDTMLKEAGALGHRILSKQP